MLSVLGIGLLVSLATMAVAASLPEAGAVRPVPVVITNDYTEGVVVDRFGNLYFSHGKVITRIGRDGKVLDWAETGSPNGHKILPNGEHLVCDGSHHAVLRLDANGQILANATGAKSEDLEIRSPNDITLDPKGGFYFTDSVPKTGAVHYVAPDGMMKVIARNVNFANGVALSADRKRLLYGESQENRIMIVKLKAPGVPDGPPRVFADLPKNTERPGWEFNQPDGIALDASGRLWVAHYGMKSIHVLSKSGELVRTYDGGNVTTSNLCFAGPDFNTLYATGGEPGGVFRLDVNVHGLRLLPKEQTDPR
jgi:gluconolactonase